MSTDLLRKQSDDVIRSFDTVLWEHGIGQTPKGMHRVSCRLVVRGWSRKPDRGSFFVMQGARADVAACRPQLRACLLPGTAMQQGPPSHFALLHL